MNRRESPRQRLNRARRALWSYASNTFSGFNEDNAIRMSAALAYYSIFSLTPLVLLVGTLAGWVFGEDVVHREVHRQLVDIMGDRASQAVESMAEAWQQNGSAKAAYLGAIALLFGASGVFGQIQDALNTIWRVKARPQRGFWLFVRHRFLSLTMVLGSGFLLLISLILTTLLNAFARRL